MKTDVYTKIVLTVIAIRSAVNLLKVFGVKLNTGSNPSSRRIPASSANHLLNVNITHINGCALEDNYNGYVIPVEMIKNRDK